VRRWALAVVVVASLAVALPTTATGATPPAAKRVRLPFPQYDGTLTPYTFELGYPLVTLVYDTLLWRDARGIPRPWLAKSVKRSNGGRRVTVLLRRGVRWQDGKALSAQDVAFTFELVARRFHPRFTPEVADVERVQATGPRTVRIDLRRPSLGFDDQPLADLPILPRHLWEGVAADEVPRGLPIGSGPYRLVRARRGGYSFRANGAYFNGKPRVARIEVPIIGREDRTYRALQRREVDMLPISLPRSAAEELGAAVGINVLTGPSYSGTALVFNLRRPPFDRPAARRAVASALDLGRIVRNVGPAVAADRGYIHPASRWSSGKVLQRFSAAKARAALTRLRLPTIRVLAPDNDPVRLEAGRQVQLALRRAGVGATVVELSPDGIGEAIGESGSAPDFEAAIVSIPALASYDPDFITRIFGVGSRTAPLNFSGYRSARFRALAERVASAPDDGARRRAVAAELALLAQDAPEVPLFFSRGVFAYRPAVYDGWIVVKGTGILDKRSFLEGQARARGGSGTGGGDGLEAPPEDSGSVLDVIAPASLVVLAIALALGVVGLVRRGSIRR
jgi:peptide/nickel transport system substrate-binding protein